MSLKELKNWIIAIFVIIILFTLILLFRCFVIDKNVFPGTKKSVSESSSKNKSESNKNTSKIKEFGKDLKNGYSNSSKNDKDYNTFNFDDRLLMYEGDHYGKNVNAVFGVLIEDADDDFYSKPIVVLENFGDGKDAVIEFKDAKSYKEDLKNAENAIQDGVTYNVSFRYGALDAIAREVVITKR